MFAQSSYTVFGTKNTPCRIVFLLTLALYLVAIPFSRFMMSLAGVILAVNWLLESFLEKKLWQKLVQAAKSKILLGVLLIYLVHILWFISSKNTTYAFQDIWIKVPLLFIPIIFYTSKPLNRKEIHFLLFIYVIGVLFSSFFGFFTYLHHAFDDKRTMAVYISYVRLELNFCFAIFISFYLLLQDSCLSFLRKQESLATKRLWVKPAMTLFTLFALIWFLFLMIYAGLVTGIVLLFVISFVLTVRAVVKQKKSLIRYVLSTIFLLAAGGFFLFVSITAKNYFTAPPFDSKKIEYTADGNAYASDFDKRYVENGNYVFAYLCDLEVREAWNKRSAIDYEELSNTLIRYLNSKGLRKDRLAVESLTTEEITTIENGIANIAYTTDFSIIKRIYELFWEINDYRQTGSVVGYTFPQRLELWKVSLSAIKKHPLLGVGTGDVKDAFAKELEEKDSPLAFTNKRSHNQYFTFLIAFGIIGLGLILFSIIYPVIVFNKFKDPLFLIFFLIIILSMFTEDSLEPQDGVTFFAFFYSFFLFLDSEKPLIMNEV